MKKKFKLLAVVMAAVMCMTACSVLLAACTDTETETYTVTYYDSDATTVLKTEEVEAGGYATEWMPEKDGYTFSGWYATPNSTNFEFDFTEAIEEDTSVFAMWASATQSDDTRTYYIVGSGTSPLLSQSNWGNDIDNNPANASQYQLTKVEGENVYYITLDLYAGDQFQFSTTGSTWTNQRGWGYVQGSTLEDGTQVFSGSTSVYGSDAYRSDIIVDYTGNYTLYLTTHPDDDLYDTENDYYTEETKDQFNYNPLDTITWEYNGEPTDEVEATVSYYIKGNLITDWNNMYNASTQMSEVDEGIYELEVYLVAGDEVMFYGTMPVDGVTTEVAWVNVTDLDADSAELFEGTNNITVVTTGLYTFTYDSENDVLSATVDTTYTPEEYDYYLDGSLGAVGEDGNRAWGAFITDPDTWQLTDEDGDGVYELNDVTLEEGMQINLRAFIKDSELDSSYTNNVETYQYSYLLPSPSFTQYSATNANILVVKSGTYDITFDTYSKILEISAGYDIYISGSMQPDGTWNPNFDTQYLFTQSEDDENVYTLEWTFEVGDQFGLRIFPWGSTAEDVEAGTASYSWVGVSAGNADDTVTATFLTEASGNSNNFQCTVAGTYILSYNVSTGVLTISLASA